MSKSLNFNKITKKYFTVTLPDEKSTTILVAMPTKALLRELTGLKIDANIVNDNDGLGALDEIYHICARLMSRNKVNVKITKEYLEEIFDFEDILIFLKEDMGFISEAISVKN